MNSFQENQRQIRIAIVAIAIIFTIGVTGFMLFEKFSLLDSIWLTVITLATIGYGDVVAHTTAGRIFTVLLILFGLGAVAYGLQATAGFFLSPAVRDLRQRRRTQHHIDNLKNHFIICGAGKLVDETVKTLLESANTNSNAHHHFYDLFRTRETLLDIVVIVTPDPTFAAHLRENELLVIEGDPTDDDVLTRAGVNHAQAMMVMLDNDTESLLTVLTARSINPDIDITAAALDEHLAGKMIRVGANGVIAHYDTAARFLNNATLRPAVSEFFSSILFTHNSAITTVPLDLAEDSPWIGHALGSLELYQRFEAGVIGIRQDDGIYLYA
ncbi:MAG: NAD-binding protein, partial [Chloroflexota bacterium]